MESLLRGTSGLVIAYCLTLLGLFLPYRKERGWIRRLPRMLLLGLPVMIGCGIIWSIGAGAFKPVWDFLGSTFTNLAGMGFTVFGGYMTAWYLPLSGPVDRFKRGVAFLGMADALEAERGDPGVSLAGQMLSLFDETKHVKLIGTTETGKSTAIGRMLGEALARGDRAVIADPDGSYLKQFYRKDRGDVILNPFDERSARWDLFAEIYSPHDADRLARALIPDYDGDDRSWRQYARTFLTAVLRQLHAAGDRDLTRLYWVLLMAPVEELKVLLDGTPAAPFLGSDNGRFFDSVRSVVGVHVAALEFIASQTQGELLSIREWVLSGEGVLFIPYHAGQVEALRQVISTWMRTAIFQTLEMHDCPQRIWFVVDELDALGPIDVLKDALARLRKFGGRCVLGFQSIAQVRGTYGDTEAQTIVENCGTTMILRCSASERGGTAEFASRLIGQREVIRPQTTRNNASSIFPWHWGTTSVTDQRVIEDAVLASEIEQLPDLRGFLKIASVPEWVRINLAAGG